MLLLFLLHQSKFIVQQETHDNAKTINLGDEAVIMSEFVATQLEGFAELFKAPSKLVTLKEEAKRINICIEHKARLELEREMKAKRLALEEELAVQHQAIEEGDVSKISKKRGRPKKRIS